MIVGGIGGVGGFGGDHFDHLEISVEIALCMLPQRQWSETFPQRKEHKYTDTCSNYKTI